MRCDGCGKPFMPRRRDHRYCSALDTLQRWLQAEVARWEPLAAGAHRRRVVR